MTTDTKKKPPRPLTNDQKKQLRRYGHALNPLVNIGKEGLTATVLQEIETSLQTNELIKVKLLNTAPLDKHQASLEIPAHTGSVLVQLVGKTLLLYRPNPKRPKDKRIIVR